ncbi:MAG: hypothetical protein FWD33_01235 [Alphaproteobacteria bacterium]|nr:hypothetical protein [Alphaproteobacteria bacterium]
MKKILLAIICGSALLTLVADANPQTARGRPGAGTPQAGAQQATAATAGQAAVGARQRPGAGAQPAAGAGQATAGAPAVRARAGTGQAAQQPTAQRARAATAPAAGAPVTARSGTTPVQGAPGANVARSGTMQRPTGILTQGVQVQAAAEATGLVNEECRNMWFGCMDTLCILGNEHGMRCSCSDERKRFDTILAEIETMNDNIRRHGAAALERINMTEAERANVDEIMRQVGAYMDITDNPAAARTSVQARPRPRTNFVDAFANLNLDGTVGFEEFGAGEDLSKLQGAALFSRASNICRVQIRDRLGQACTSREMEMIQTMYNQMITSDCRAYETEIRQRRQRAVQNLEVVNAAAREAIVDQYRERNRLDLGGCVGEFRSCMTGPEVCGDGWIRCATNLFDQHELTGASQTGERIRQQNAPSFTRGGITVTAATMERMESKRIMCDRVLDSCQDVRDQVWDRFLGIVMPELRSGELMTGALARTACIPDVVNCIMTTCNVKFGSDEASMEACFTDRDLARESCASGMADKTTGQRGLGIDKCEGILGQGLWFYIDDKLASMRINACSTAVRAAVENPNVCGPTLSLCGGMSVDQVLNMIVRFDSNDTARGQTDSVLTACREVQTLTAAQRAAGQQADYSDVGPSVVKIRPIIQGLLLGMDTALTLACTNAAQTRMMEVCGSLENCDKVFGAGVSAGLVPTHPYVINIQPACRKLDNSQDIAEQIKTGLQRMIDRMNHEGGSYWREHRISDWTNLRSLLDPAKDKIAYDAFTDMINWANHHANSWNVARRTESRRMSETLRNNIANVIVVGGNFSSFSTNPNAEVCTYSVCNLFEDLGRGAIENRISFVTPQAFADDAKIGSNAGRQFAAAGNPASLSMSQFVINCGDERFRISSPSNERHQRRNPHETARPRNAAGALDACPSGTASDHATGHSCFRNCEGGAITSGFAPLHCPFAQPGCGGTGDAVGNGGWGGHMPDAQNIMNRVNAVLDLMANESLEACFQGKDMNALTGAQTAGPKQVTNPSLLAQFAPIIMKSAVANYEAEVDRYVAGRFTAPRTGCRPLNPAQTTSALIMRGVHITPQWCRAAAFVCEP